MGQHCHVKICINYRLDHRVGGLEVYNSLKDQLLHAQFDPFRYWYLHKCISHTWDMKKKKYIILHLSLLEKALLILIVVLSILFLLRLRTVK